MLLSVAWAAELPRHLRLVLHTEQFLAAMLAIALGLVFVHLGADRRPHLRVPWYDRLLGVAGFGLGSYLAFDYPALVDRFTYDPADGVVLGVLLLALVFEGLRRTAGWSLTLIVGAFFVYGLLGHLVPGRLAGRSLQFDRLTTYLITDPSAVLGLPMTVATTIVVAFVLFGNLLARSGGSIFFTDAAVALMGRYRGGSAKIAIFASGLFGSISGSAVSNVVSTGVITIPLMRQGGYPAHVAGAIEAVASTGGQLMPPVMGAAAFLMAEFLQIPYASVVLAALVPAVIYYAALFIQADLRAAQAGIARIDPALIPRLARTFAEGWYFPLPFVVLIVALFRYNLQPESAALYAAIALVICAVALGFRGRRLSASQLLGAVRDTGIAVLEIVMITAAAGILIGVLNLSGLSFGLTLVLAQLGAGNVLVLLFVAAFICILLGLGMPTVGVYVLLAALVAPSLVELGIEPIAAHLFVLYFGMMSMITPPVAIAAFAAASLAKSDPMRTGLEAVRFGWPAYVVPFLFVFSPSLLLLGDPFRLVLAVSTALGGVWLVSIGLIGYFVRPLGPLPRLAFAAAGFALMVPAGMFPGALTTDLVGLICGVALVAHELYRRRRRPL